MADRLVAVAARAYAARGDDLHDLGTCAVPWPPTGSSSRPRWATRPTPTASRGDGSARCRGADRPPARPRCHLPAPDAAAAAAVGARRRRVRRAGLPQRARGPRHRRRPARAGGPAARRGDQPLPRPGAQPRRPRARVGGTGAGRRAALPRLLPHLSRPYRTRRVGGDAAAGVPGSRSGMASRGTRRRKAGSGRRSRTSSGTSTGRTRRCSRRSPTSALVLAGRGIEVFRLDAHRVHVEAPRRTARTNRRAHRYRRRSGPCSRSRPGHVVFKAEAIVGPEDLRAYLGRGERDHGRVSELAYHNALMVHGWSMLASGAPMAVLHALRARRCPRPTYPGSPTSAATTTSAGRSTRPTPAAVGRTEPRLTALPRRVDATVSSGSRAPADRSSAQPRDRRLARTTGCRCAVA